MGGIRAAVEQKLEHVTAVAAGMKERCLTAEGDEVGRPNGFGGGGAGDFRGGGVDIEPAVDEFLREVGEVELDREVEEGGALEGIEAVVGVEGAAEGFGIFVQRGAEKCQGFAVNCRDRVFGRGDSGPKEKLDALGLEGRSEGAVQQVRKGVAGAVEAAHGAGGIGSVFEQKADAFGVEAFAGGEKHGAVGFVIESVGRGPEFHEQVCGVELTEGAGFGEGLVEVFGGGFGAEFADAVELSGGGGVEDGRIIGLHGRMEG